MQIKAESKFIRLSPRKLRLVADLVRPLSLDEALAVLTHLRKRAAQTLLKTLKQAQANAVNNYNLPQNSLTIHSIEINQGPTYKRWQPVSRGRAHSIHKKTSHLKVVLNSKTPKTKSKAGTKAKTRSQKPAAPKTAKKTQATKKITKSKSKK